MNVWVILVAVVLLFLPITDWLAVRVLHRASREGSGSTALSERARMAVVLATATSINAIMGGTTLAFTITQNPSFLLDPSLTTMLLSVSLVLPGVPNIYWLGLYYRARLRRDQ